MTGVRISLVEQAPFRFEHLVLPNIVIIKLRKSGNTGFIRCSSEQLHDVEAFNDDTAIQKIKCLQAAFVLRMMFGTTCHSSML
ncbi:hypothetical protein [Lacticaseibacillus thailandensis]|uniref:hypothetical protein n=1 Tax=Lacticaseibacillus thailandensis TaxID=381741 RepID=UPI0006D00DB0|nr:hypothetical protein [Lacticaseibacillus thailandensis]